LFILGTALGTKIATPPDQSVFQCIQSWSNIMDLESGSAIAEPQSTGSGTTPTYGWSIKGITFETKGQVKRAAKLVSKPIGIWVNDVLQRAAIETIKSASAPPAPIHTANTESALEAKVDQLALLVQSLLPTPKSKGKSKSGKSGKGKSGKSGKKRKK
jgi:hypothetical protein